VSFFGELEPPFGCCSEKFFKIFLDKIRNFWYNRYMYIRVNHKVGPPAYELVYPLEALCTALAGAAVCTIEWGLEAAFGYTFRTSLNHLYCPACGQRIYAGDIVHEQGRKGKWSNFCRFCRPDLKPAIVT